MSIRSKLLLYIGLPTLAIYVGVLGLALQRLKEANRTELEATVTQRAVSDAVQKQAKPGVDIASDGEMSKISYGTYIRHRLNGFEEGNVPRATPK